MRTHEIVPFIHIQSTTAQTAVVDLVLRLKKTHNDIIMTINNSLLAVVGDIFSIIQAH